MSYSIQRLFSVPLFCLVSIFLKAMEAQKPPPSPKHVGFSLYILHLNLPQLIFLHPILNLSLLILPKLQKNLFF